MKPNYGLLLPPIGIESHSQKWLEVNENISVLSALI